MSRAVTMSVRAASAAALAAAAAFAGAREQTARSAAAAAAQAAPAPAATSAVPAEASAAGMATNASAILRQADKARGNLGGVVWEVTLVSSNRTRSAAATISYHVQAKGFDFAATATQPAKQRGQKVVMVKGNMWFHKPDLNKPVPISQRQKLMGNAAYGDIAATNYEQDYTAKFLPEETVEGEPCHVFDLVAKSKERTTYDRVVYWVSKRRTVGVKADYYSVSGQRLKSAVMAYDAVAQGGDGGGQVFISGMTIRNELGGAEVTTLAFANPRLEAVPDRVFNINLLMK